MKRFYSITCALAAFAISASAANMTLSTNTNPFVKSAMQPKQATEMKTINSGSFKGSFNNNANTTAKRAQMPSIGDEATWKSIGTGTWCEDFFTIYNDVDAYQSWEVEVEECVEEPGHYRVLPYASTEVGLGALLGEGDTTNYMYIDATNPDKVMFDDFYPFDSWIVSLLCPESDWPEDYQCYGTLADKVITFPLESCAVFTGSGFTLTCRNTGTQLFLPGAEVTVKDYSLSLEMTEGVCCDDDAMDFNIKAGADVAGLKYVILPGNYNISDDNFQVVAQIGDDIKAGNCTFNNEPNAGLIQRYTLLIAAVDADGNYVGGKGDYFYMLNDREADWQTVGTAEFAEDIVSPTYQDVESEVLGGDLQESLSNPGLFRIVNPFAGHSLADMCALPHSHNHYIYINAEDPDFVYMIDSPVGFDFAYGDVSFSSLGGLFFENGYTKDEIRDAGFGGTYEDGLVSFPEGDVVFAEKEYDGGEFYQAESPIYFEFTRTNQSGVINTIGNAANESVEYYNLQGMKIANPAEGQVVIRRQGKTASKVLVK